MNDIISFFRHPSYFYKQILEGKLRVSILCVIVTYLMVYVFWGIKIGPMFDEHYSRFLFDDRILDIIISPWLNLAISIILSLIIYFVSKALRFQIKLSSIIFSVFSLEMISIILVSSQLCLFYAIGQVPYIRFWEVIATCWQMVYLFIAIRALSGSPNSKSILIQVFSIVILVGVIAGTGIYHRSVVQQGLMYMNNFEFGKAIDKFMAGVQQDTSNAMNYLYFGEAYRYSILEDIYSKNEVIEKARQAYNRSLALDPRLLDARIGLGFVYSFNQQYEDALREFEIVATSDPGNTDVYKEIGKIYLALDKPQLAKKYFLMSSDVKKDDSLTRKMYHFQSVDKISLRENRHVTIESQITWDIVDPVLYRGSIREIKLAETRIHDLYYAILMKNIYNCGQELRQVGDDIRKKVVAECNKSKLMTNFGIRIVDLTLSKK